MLRALSYSTTSVPMRETDPWHPFNRALAADANRSAPQGLRRCQLPLSRSALSRLKDALLHTRVPKAQARLWYAQFNSDAKLSVIGYALLPLLERSHHGAVIYLGEKPLADQARAAQALAWLTRALRLLADHPLERRDAIADALSRAVHLAGVDIVAAMLQGRLRYLHGEIDKRPQKSASASAPPSKPLRQPATKPETLIPSSAPPVPMPPPALVPPKLPTPPNSLEECVQRLSDARAKLEAIGYIPPFSDNELLAMAQSAAVDGLKERFLVKILPSRYANAAALLGMTNSAGSVVSWASTFSCLEAADTDPELIRNLLGLDYLPTETYSLAIIDTLGIEDIAELRSLVPTWENLGELGRTEFSDEFPPELIDRAFQPAMASDYAKVKQAAARQGVDLKVAMERRKLAEAVLGSPEQADLFDARYTMDKEYGANEYFLGEGVTKNIAGGDRRYGALEAISYERHPVTQGQLQECGKLQTIADLKPLSKRPKIG